MESKKGYIEKASKPNPDMPFEISIHPDEKGIGCAHRFPLHWHEYYEFEIYLTGHAVEYVNEKIIEKGKGSFSILTPSACHAVEMDDDVLLINMRLWERFFNGHQDIIKALELSGGAISGTLPHKDYDRLIYMCQILRDECSESKFLSEANRNLILYIVLKLFDNRNESFKTRQIEKQFCDVLYFINHNFSKKITVESISKEFGFTSNYFGKKFFSQVGVSFNEYINNIRLNYAYSLIVDNEQTIENISSLCGFSSRTYFSTLFRNKFGISPSECLKKVKNSTD